MQAPALTSVARASGAAAVVCAMAAGLLTFVVPSVNALPQERITLHEGEIKEVTFPRIAANNPANDLHTPEQCNVSAYCDTIPVTIVRPPDFDDADDYFVQFKLSWESEKVPFPADPSGEYAANDLDMFLYNDPIQETAGPDGDGVIANGASGGEPEVAYLFKPNGTYSVVVVNYVGANTGYTLKLTWVSESISTPFESLAPRFTPRAPATTVPRPDPVDIAEPLASPPPTLEPLPVLPDVAFDSGFGPDDFEETLAAPVELDYQPATAEPPGPPSTVALVLWMLVLPLAAVAVGGSILSRRSAHLLRL